MGSKVEKTILLDAPGIVLALVMGGIIIFFGSWYHFFLMIIFFTLSVLATKYGYNKKKSLGIYEHERSWENVLANGLGPIIALSLQVFGFAGVGPYVATIAAVTSDKFASEMGALAGKPIDLGTLKPAKQGTSGCVSVFGTLMSFTGALLIGLSGYIFFGFSPIQVLFVAIIGFMGSVVDSVFGVLEEKGIGNKTTTNLICSLVGIVGGFFI